MAYDSNNIFAKILRGEVPSFKVYEDEHSYVMMDIMPQSLGHTLVLTKEPAETLFDMSYEGGTACMHTVQKVAKVLKEITNADGMVFTQYNYAAAGQTVPHVHFHLIPRFNGQKIKAHSNEMGNMDEIKVFAEKFAKALA